MFLVALLFGVPIFFYPCLTVLNFDEEETKISAGSIKKSDCFFTTVAFLKI